MTAKKGKARLARAAVLAALLLAAALFPSSQSFARLLRYYGYAGRLVTFAGTQAGADML